MSKGTKYTDEFKSQIVALYDSGKKDLKLSRDYDISVPSIYKWINESKTTGSFRMKDNMTDEQKELIELRKPNIQLEMENDILKQVALIMLDKSKSLDAMLQSIALDQCVYY